MLRYVLVLGLIVLAFVSGMAYSDVQNDLTGFDVPDDEYNVTCYSWVENGSHNVQCPSLVYAPNQVVNITVVHEKPVRNPF